MKRPCTPRMGDCTLLVLLAATAGAAVWLARQRQRSPGKLLGQRHYERSLAQRYGPAESRRLMQSIAGRHADLVQRIECPQHPALREHLYGNILPGLAVYQGLQAGGLPVNVAWDELARLLRRQMTQRGALIGLLLRLPGSFELFRRGLRRMMTTQYPAEGWQIEWLADNRDRMAFDLKTCYYLNTLTQLGAPELTPLFCQTDEWLAGPMAPQVLFRRRTTQASGGEKCDFCYLRGSAYQHWIDHREIQLQ